jgi:hypothetical protein
LTQSFRPHYGPGVESASNRNEYQKYILGGKGGRYVDWQPCHLHVPIYLKSGSLSLLEPSGLSRSVMGLLYLYLPVTVARACLLTFH